MKRLRSRQLRSSRVMLTVLGLVLIAIGVAGLVLSFDAIDRLADPLDADTAVWNDAGRALVEDNQRAWQLGVVGLGLLVVAIGLSWLARQIPPIRHHQDLELPEGDSGIAGTSTLAGAAVAEAFEQDLERSSCIERARVEFRRDGPVRVRLDVVEDHPVDELLDELVTPAFDRLVRVGGIDPRPDLAIDLRLVAPPARSVA